MQDQKEEIKKGIMLHKIDTEKFKTNLVAIFLSIKLSRENVTKNAVLSSVLRRGTKQMPTQEEISKKLEEMYGADFNCGLDKTGDNHILKFYIETVNDEYLPQDAENMLKQSIEKLSEIVFNPYLENGTFKKEYVDQEKEKIKQIIEAKKDNKARYAKERCIEEMYKNEVTGLYKYGYIEDLEKINEQNLFEYYKELLNRCKIDIFISGNLKNAKVREMIEEDENIGKLSEREPDFKVSEVEIKAPVEKENVITESMDVVQGKLVIGLDIEIDEEDLKNEDLRYQAFVYNSLLRR